MEIVSFQDSPDTLDATGWMVSWLPLGKNEQVRKVFRARFIAMVCLVLAEAVDPGFFLVSFPDRR